MLAWLSVWSEVQTCIWPSWCHCHSLFLASVKSRLVLPFWYQLTWVVPEKGPLNVCVCVCSIFISAAPSPCHPYLEQVKHVASRECSSKVNILQDKPATRLLAVCQCLPDLSQMTLVIFHSKCNGSHSTFHTNLPGKLLHHADWIPEQLAYDIHTCTLFNGYSQEELSWAKCCLDYLPPETPLETTG